MADVVYTFGADDSAFNRVQKRMLKEHERNAARMRRTFDRTVRGIEMGMVGVGAALASGLAIAREYTSEFTFARREVEKLTAAFKPLTRGIGRDLFGAANNTSGGLGKMIEMIEDARTQAVNFVAGGGIFGVAGRALGLLGPNNADQIDAERRRQEQQDLRNRSLRIAGDRVRQIEMELATLGGDRAGVATQRAIDAAKNEIAELSRRQLAGEIDGTAVERLTAEIERLRNATIESIRSEDRAQRHRERMANEAQTRARERLSAERSVSGRAARARASGDEFAARRIEIEGRAGIDAAEAARLPGLAGIGARAEAFTRRGVDLEALNKERAEAERLLDLELKRGRASVMRSRGEAEAAERLELQLDYAERIRDVERSTILSEDAKRRAVAQLGRQRDALLAGIGGGQRAETVSARTVATGLSSTVTNAALGGPGRDAATAVADNTGKQLTVMQAIERMVGRVTESVTSGLIRA